jgi:hypothetical protein
MKVLVEATGDRILGFAMIGPEAGEIMAAVQMALLGGLSYAVFQAAILAHPTMAEGPTALFAAIPARKPGDTARRKREAIDRGRQNGWHAAPVHWRVIQDPGIGREITGKTHASAEGTGGASLTSGRRNSVTGRRNSVTAAIAAAHISDPTGAIRPEVTPREGCVAAA